MPFCLRFHRQVNQLQLFLHVWRAHQEGVNIPTQVQFINILDLSWRKFYLLVGLTISSQCALRLHKSWPHSNISSFNCCANFSWSRHFFTPMQGVFVYRISQFCWKFYIFWWCTNYSNLHVSSYNHPYNIIILHIFYLYITWLLTTYVRTMFWYLASYYHSQSKKVIMNHDSGFIIGIAQKFAKILIERSLNIFLKIYWLWKNSPISSFNAPKIIAEV